MTATYVPPGQRTGNRAVKKFLILLVLIGCCLSRVSTAQETEPAESTTTTSTPAAPAAAAPVETAAATSTPAVPAAAAPALNIQLVFLRMPNRQIRMIRAKTAETKDEVLTVVDLEDKPSRFPANFLIGMLPAYTEAAVQLKDDELDALIVKYDNEAASKSELKAELLRERIKFQAILEKRKAEKDALEAQMQAAFAAYTKDVFNPAMDYKAEELTVRIEAGAKLKEQYPSFGEKIDAYLAPWVERSKLLAEGRVRFEGKWMTRDEIKAVFHERRQGQMKAFLDTDPKLTISSTAVAQNSVALGLGFVLLSVALCLYMLVHILGESRYGINLLGWLMILVSLGLLGVYGYFGFKIYNGSGTIDTYTKSGAGKSGETEGVGACDRLFYLAAEGNSKLVARDDQEVILTEQEINGTLKKRLCFVQSQVSGGTYDIIRDGLQVRLLQDRVLFLDQTHWLGKPWLFRYELYFRSEKNLIEYYKCDVTVGKTPLPSQISNYLWRNYQQHLWDCLRKSGIPRLYQVEKIEDGKLTLVFHMPRT